LEAAGHVHDRSRRASRLLAGSPGRFHGLIARRLLGTVATIMCAISVAWAQQAIPSISTVPVLRAEPASRVTLPIEVGPPGRLPRNSFVRIRGLPPTVALSDGYAIGAGSWAVALAELPKLAVILPAGAQGSVNVAITLVSVDGEVLAETTTVLTVTAPAPPAPTPASRPPEPANAPAPQRSSADREKALTLHAKGMEQIERGNIFAARKFFERATEAGLAQSAIALASTYDPDELSKLKVIGLQPNPEEARKWYEKARELGAQEAAARLQRLGAAK
jgi:hypothetical protein